MNREPINPDDPDLTAYALGELSPAERREFETKLESSPAAREELESMEDVMSLLSNGLRDEWTTEMNAPALEVLPELPSHHADAKIVEGPFNRSRRTVGTIAAAAAAVALLAGALVAFQEVESGLEISGSGEVEREMTVASLDSAAGVHVPRLVLGSEVEGIGDLSLSEAIENLEELTPPVDATYLEADSVAPGSHSAAPRAAGVVPVGFAGVSSDRIDSYLPPVGAERVPETGLIERRVRRAAEETQSGASHPTRVFVRGYIPFDEVARSVDRSSNQILAGFRPVSMSGNPVLSGEYDLRLMAELQSVQKEMSRLADRFPAGSAERAEFQRLLDRNGEAIKALKAQFAD